jgi:hypothetical protein
MAAEAREGSDFDLAIIKANSVGLSILMDSCSLHRLRSSAKRADVIRRRRVFFEKEFITKSS